MCFIGMTKVAGSAIKEPLESKTRKHTGCSLSISRRKWLMSIKKSAGEAVFHACRRTFFEILYQEKFGFRKARLFANGFCPEDELHTAVHIRRDTGEVLIFLRDFHDRLEPFCQDIDIVIEEVEDLLDAF